MCGIAGKLVHLSPELSLQWEHDGGPGAHLTLQSAFRHRRDGEFVLHGDQVLGTPTMRAPIIRAPVVQDTHYMRLPLGCVLTVRPVGAGGGIS